MSLKLTKAAQVVNRLMQDGSSFTVRTEKYINRGGHGNDVILDAGFNYLINFSSSPDIVSFIDFCTINGIEVKWNAGTGWEFS